MSNIERTAHFVIVDHRTRFMYRGNLKVLPHKHHRHTSTRARHEDYVFPEKTPELRALSERAKKLKAILSRVPAEIVDRPKFLALIREVAVAIKVRTHIACSSARPSDARGCRCQISMLKE